MRSVRRNWVVVLLGIILILAPVSFVSAGTCDDCISGCNAKYRQDMNDCYRWMPPGILRTRCIGDASYNKAACETDCRANSDDCQCGWPNPPCPT